MQEDGRFGRHLADTGRRLSSCLSSASWSFVGPRAHCWAPQRSLPTIEFAILRSCATLHRMVREPNHPDNSHPADQKFLAPIDTHGWNVTNIFRREGEAGPEWSFSTGLFHSYQHAEILIFGLELDNMQKIVNTIGSGIKRGQVRVWKRVSRHLRPVWLSVSRCRNRLLSGLLGVGDLVL